MKKLVHDFKVLSNRKLNCDSFVIEAQAPVPLPAILPGQFINVLVPNSKDAFLRRPLSIHFVDYERNTISLFIKIMGKGTRQLWDIKENDTLSIVYPLGNSYSVPTNSNVVLFGGGCGIAPMLYLAKHLQDAGTKVTTILGVRTKEQLFETENYTEYSDVLITTEDGSLGEKGYPTQHSVLSNNKFDYYFTCGPEPMMKAVANLAKKNQIECEVSLENTMACGFGACLCCVTDTTEGNKCTCTEGPVFNINDLKW